MRTNLKLNAHLDYSSDSQDGPPISGDHLREGAEAGKVNYIIAYGEGPASQAQRRPLITLRRYFTSHSEICLPWLPRRWIMDRMPLLKMEPPTAADAAEIARSLEAFLADHPQASVIEDGRVLFDMRTAKYALSSEHGRCVLHLWSEDRNLVRTIVGLDLKNRTLRLHAKRFGQTKPQRYNW